MPAGSKVVWFEGMLLRTQHFQQHGRYVESLVARRTRGMVPYGWGFEAIRIDPGPLQNGQIALAEARGVMPDGTPFEFPDDAIPAVGVPDHIRDTIIYLALPIWQPGALEVAEDSRADVVTRFISREEDLIDSVNGAAFRSTIRVASLRFRLLRDGQDLSGFVTLPVGRVVEVRTDRQIILDTQFIPPVLNCAAAAPLLSHIADISGRIRQRAEAVAVRFSTPGSGTMAETAEIMMLQLLNRSLALGAALGADAGMQHPWALYQFFTEIAGELATFTTDTHLAPALPPYRHHDLNGSFGPLVDVLRDELSRILPPSALSISLQDRGFSVRVAVIQDTNLFKSATFYVAARSSQPIEEVTRQFHTQVKFAPIENIRQVVNSALPGIPMRPLQTAPRQLPYSGGMLYYELDRNNAFWKQMERPGGTNGLAVHVGAALPDLELQLWAVTTP